MTTVIAVGEWVPRFTGAHNPQKEKGPTLVGPVRGINYSANRPDPDDPGGLGAEESGIERTGPLQNLLVAIQKGGRWAEVGRYYDSANDPVTACCSWGRDCRLR